MELVIEPLENSSPSTLVDMTYFIVISLACFMRTVINRSEKYLIISKVFLKSKLVYIELHKIPIALKSSAMLLLCELVERNNAL